MDKDCNALPFDIIHEIVLKTECRENAIRVALTCRQYYRYICHWLQLPITINARLDEPSELTKLHRVAKNWVPSDVIRFALTSDAGVVIDHVSRTGELAILRC
jgi:hypothetical protein